MNPPVFTFASLTVDVATVPELMALQGVPQPAKHHPEIDTFVHVMMAMDQAARLSSDPAVHFAVLLHDLGKGTTPKEVLPSHHDHEARGAPLVDLVARRLGAPEAWRRLAVDVCTHHTRCHRALEMRPGSIAKLFVYIEAHARPDDFERFLLACEADARGRLGLEDREYRQPNLLRERFEESRADLDAWKKKYHV
jgi:tRNA nucleotidyltransferase (CCA-adding enzyme)